MRKHICFYDFSYVGYHAYDYECVTECIKRDIFKNEETEETYALITYVSYDYVSLIVYKADSFKNEKKMSL